MSSCGSTGRGYPYTFFSRWRSPAWCSVTSTRSANSVRGTSRIRRSRGIRAKCTHQFEAGRLDYYTNNLAAYSLWVNDEWIGFYPRMGENGWKALYNLYILDEYLNNEGDDAA